MANSLLKELFTPSMEAHDDAEAQVGYGIDSMEHATVEVMEAHDAVVSAEQAFEELEVIHAGLESIHASLEASLEDGGLDPVAAQFAHHAVDAHVSRLGLEAKDTLPSLEAFGGDTGRQTSTTVSMEATEGTMSKIFEAIRRAIDAIIKATTDFFSKLFGNAEKLEKAVDATMKKVKDVKGSPKGKMRVANAESLATNGSVVPGLVATGLKQTTATFEKMAGDYISAATEGQAALIEKIKQSKGADKAEDFSGATDASKKMAEDIKSAVGDAKLPVIGGRQIMMKVEGEGDDMSVDVQFGKDEDAKKLDGNEIDTPSQSDLEKVLGNAKSLASAMKSSKKTIDGAVKNYRQVNKVTEELNKDAKGGKLGKFLADAKAKRDINKAGKNMVKPVQGLSSHCWSAVRAAVGYAETALKNYGDEKKDDDK